MNKKDSFKIKMFEILNLTDGFNKLVETSLSISTSMKLMRMQELFIKEQELFNRQRDKLVKEFGEIANDKKTIEVKQENKHVFSDKMEDLLNTEVVVYLDKIKINELKDNSGEEIFISANDLYRLRPILED